MAGAMAMASMVMSCVIMPSMIVVVIMAGGFRSSQRKSR